MQIIIKIIVLILIAVTLVLLTYKLRDRKKNTISFKESLDLAEIPVITFYQNETKLNFLLDTGSNISIIDKKVYDIIETKETNRQSTLAGLGGEYSTNPIVTITFTYLEKIFTDDFQVVDMTSTFATIKQRTGVTINGIIGSKFMQKYKYVLDFKEMIAYSKK